MSYKFLLKVQAPYSFFHVVRWLCRGAPSLPLKKWTKQSEKIVLHGSNWYILSILNCFWGRFQNIWKLLLFLGQTAKSLSFAWTALVLPNICILVFKAITIITIILYIISTANSAKPILVFVVILKTQMQIYQNFVHRYDT